LTLQTLVVLMIGVRLWLAARCATVIAYLAEGAFGLPVLPVRPRFWHRCWVRQPVLFGFVAAAFVTGWLSERGWDRSVPLLFVADGLGHIVILAAGFGCSRWHEARRREGMACRDRAVPCRHHS